MSTIERVTPILARTVMAVAIISVFAAGFAAYTFDEPRLIGFIAFAGIAGMYGWNVTRQNERLRALPEIERPEIRPMAA